MADTPCGTLEFIAPEVVDRGFDHRVDVWGVGMIFYMLLTLKYAFINLDELATG